MNSTAPPWCEVQVAIDQYKNEPDHVKIQSCLIGPEKSSGVMVGLSASLITSNVNLDIGHHSGLDSPLKADAPLRGALALGF